MDSLITAYEQAWESGDASAFDGILASGFTRSVNAAEGYGSDSLKKVASGESGIEDLSIDLGEPIYGDNEAAVSWTVTGTAAGQPFSTAGAGFVTFEDGMIASERVFIDTAPMMDAMMQAEGEGRAAPDTSAR